MGMMVDTSSAAIIHHLATHLRPDSIHVFLAPVDSAHAINVALTNLPPRDAWWTRTWPVLLGGILAISGGVISQWWHWQRQRNNADRHVRVKVGLAVAEIHQVARDLYERIRDQKMVRPHDTGKLEGLIAEHEQVMTQLADMKDHKAASRVVTWFLAANQVPSQLWEYRRGLDANEHRELLLREGRLDEASEGKLNEQVAQGEQARAAVLAFLEESAKDAMWVAFSYSGGSERVAAVKMPRQ